jgi:hypothetical protein
VKNWLTLIKTLSDPDSNGLADPDLDRPKFSLKREKRRNFLFEEFFDGGGGGGLLLEPEFPLKRVKEDILYMTVFDEKNTSSA